MVVNDQLWWWGGPKCSTGGPASGLALNSSQSTVKFKPKFILQLNSIPNLCSAHQSAPCKGKLNIQYATIRSVGKQKAPLFCFDFVKSLWRDTWYFVLQGKNCQTWTFTHASTLSWMGLKDDYKEEWLVHNSMRSRRWHNQFESGEIMPT